jgi:hypothetical protein
MRIVYDKRSKASMKNLIIWFCAISIAIFSLSFIWENVRVFLNPFNQTDPNPNWNWIWQWPLYFTYQSNFFVVFALLISVFKAEENKFWKLDKTNMRFYATVWITLTMLVYWLILFPNSTFIDRFVLDPVGAFISIWVHAILPIFMILINVLYYTRHLGLSVNIPSYKSMVYVMLFPLVYMIVVVVLVQSLPLHWSVYGSNTMWYQYVDNGASYKNQVASLSDIAKWEAKKPIPLAMIAILPAVMVFNYVWYYLLMLANKRKK